jgi:hypothetical protein
LCSSARRDQCAGTTIPLARAERYEPGTGDAWRRVLQNGRVLLAGDRAALQDLDFVRRAYLGI